MTTTKHTPEPWHVERADDDSGQIDYRIIGHNGRRSYTPPTRVAYVSGDRDEDDKPAKHDADRIVACVNACKGIEDPAATIEAARNLWQILDACDDNVCLSETVDREVVVAWTKLGEVLGLRAKRAYVDEA